MTARVVSSLLCVLMFSGVAGVHRAEAKERYLKYNHRPADKEHKLEHCVVSGTTATCEQYSPKKHHFESGDVVRLEVVNAPALSFFTIRIDNDITIQPVVPIIRGVNDAAPAAVDAGESGGKGLALGTVDSRVAAQLTKIENGDEKALRDAVDILLVLWRDVESKYDPSKYGALLASIKSVSGRGTLPHGPCCLPSPPNTATASAAGAGFPGHTYEDLLRFATNVETDWTAFTGPVSNDAFARAADRTAALLKGILEVNSLLSSRARQLADTRRVLEGLSKDYASLRLSALEILNAADRSTKFKPVVENVLGSSTVQGSGSKLESLRTATELTKAVDPLFDVPVPTTPERAILAAEKAARHAKDMLTNTGCVTAELKVFTDLDEVVKELNDTVARIFTEANTVYVTYPSSDAQEIVINQWRGSHAARIEIQEMRGFVPFSFIGAPVAGPETENDPRGEGDLAEANAAEQKRASGEGGGEGESGGKGEGEEEQEEAGAAEPTTVYRFPIEIHQISRGNFVSGFARSKLATREFGLKDQEKTDDKGAPVVDKEGNPVMVKVPIQTREQDSQYLYYVGINFYTAPRDLFPGADPWYKSLAPGIMFGYVVNEEANFLLGANWEIRGVNLGVGRHYGKVKRLASGYALGDQLPAATTTAPTTDHFDHSYYFNVGFDAAVFKAIFGAVKGVKP